MNTNIDLDVLHNRILTVVGSLGFTVVSCCKFSKNGLVYDLSAADLTQIDRIEREGLFVVP